MNLETLSKINELDRKINNINKFDIKVAEYDLTITNGTLNTARNFDIVSLDLVDNASVVFQMLLDISLPASDTIKIELFFDDYLIFCESRTLNTSNNQVFIMKALENNGNSTKLLKLRISPTDTITGSLSAVKLFVWGCDNSVTSDTGSLSADTLGTHFAVLLSKNGKLYLLNQDTIPTSIDDNSLTYLRSGNNGQVVFTYDSEGNVFTNILFLTNDNRLIFISGYNTYANSISIASNVTSASAVACFEKEKLLIAYIVDGVLYYTIYYNNSVTSPTILTAPPGVSFKAVSLAKNIDSYAYVVATSTKDVNYLYISKLSKTLFERGKVKFFMTYNIAEEE